jgi:hypothetical protein
VAISLGKRVSLKILRKISFQVLDGQSGLSGQTVCGCLIFILYLRFLAKVFEKNTLPGGQFAVPMRTVCYSSQNQTERCAARWTGQTVRGLPADSPLGPGGRSAGSWRTVRPAQWAVMPAVDFSFLPLEFKCGQSARYAFFT